MRIFAVQPLTKDKTAAIINTQSAGTYIKRQSAGWIKLNHVALFVSKHDFLFR